MPVLRDDEVQRCREWQRLARIYNEVNENERNPSLDTRKFIAAVLRTIK